nr:abortive infection family protein [Caballeronia sp. INML5]
MKHAPDDHTEGIFKRILGGCQSVVQGLGSMRNKLGDAHSLGPVRARPSPRHAELAANLSGAMATFLVSTGDVHKQESSAARASDVSES